MQEVVMVDCAGGCGGRNRGVEEGWMCGACKRKNLLFDGPVRSNTRETVVRLPDLHVVAGSKRQVAFFVLAAVGITQAEVARKAGATLPSISNVLNGNIKPQAHHVKAVMELLAGAGHEGYSADELFYWGLPKDD